MKLTISNDTKSHYRPEIDGLRAVAVLSVILYHLEIQLGDEQLFKGGFFGVDIFFVISGYLITSIILTEYKKSHTFSITNFYERRVRRLLPALFTVIVFSLPFAWNLLLPQQLVDFAQSILHSIFFTSNFYWNFELQQYDAESALLQPFLHTWSLAVEEQFYIFYPIILMAIYRWHKNKIVLLFISLSVISLLFSQYMTAENASFSFYLLPSRLWELLVGGLASFISFKIPKNNPSVLYKTLPLMGLLLIIGTVIFIGFDTLHPGFITLLPIIGTVTIICFAHQDDFVSNLLTSKFMVGVGLISYSLYLWHYPIFAFGRHLVGTPTGLDKISWLILTVVLSLATFKYIEKPFRDKHNPRKKLLTILLLTLIALVSINIYWIKNNGFGERLGFYNSLLKQSKQIWVSQDGERCHSGGRGGKTDMLLEESCVFTYTSDDKFLILLGDSHAGSISENVRKLAQANKYNFIQLTKAGCQHIKGYHKRKCRQRSNNLAGYLKSYPNSIVIYSARTPLFLEKTKFVGENGEKESGYIYISSKEIDDEFPAKANAMIDTLNEISQISNKLVLVYPVPEQGFNIKDKLFKALRFSLDKQKLPTITTSYEGFLNRVNRTYDSLNQIVGKNVYRVFPENIFCNKKSGRCLVSDNENIYYEKDNHVSPLGSGLLVSEIAKELNFKLPK